jgi:hypothetical protein
MSERYNLRSKKNCPIYANLPAHNVLSGVTHKYNPYETRGLVKNYYDKAILRYGIGGTFKSNILHFLYTYKNKFTPQDYNLWLNYLSDDLYDEPILASNIHIAILIKASILDRAMEYVKTGFERIEYSKFICLENIECLKWYFDVRKELTFFTDFLLLIYKIENIINVEDYSRYEQLLGKTYKMILKLEKKYKMYKKSEKDRKNTALLHPKLPKDVCNYIIKEFL